MKKLLIMACMLPMMALGQEKMIDLSRKNIGSVTPALYTAVVSAVTGDTTLAISLLYYDARYPSLRMLESIYFQEPDRDSTEVFQFLDDLKAAKQEIGSKATTTWGRNRYKMTVLGGLNVITIGEPDGGAYFSMNGRNVDGLIAWFVSIGYSRP